MKRAPSYKNPPSAMNPDAMDVWRHVVKHYADDIYESKAMRDQWRKAKSHFERACSLKGIPPYALLPDGREVAKVTPLVHLATRLERLSRSF
jgi:hypothetical protein